jgi:hypothetical protein
MAVVLTFTAVTLIALAATVATVRLLHPHLDRLLAELCGTSARAGFWVAATLLGLGICGLLSGTASFGYPGGDDATTHDLFLGGATQLRTLLIGLLGSLIVIAWVLVAVIRGFEARADRRAYYAAMQPPAGPPTPPAAANSGA